MLYENVMFIRCSLAHIGGAWREFYRILYTHILWGLWCIQANKRDWMKPNKYFARHTFPPHTVRVSSITVLIISFYESWKPFLMWLAFIYCAFHCGSQVFIDCVVACSWFVSYNDKFIFPWIYIYITARMSKENCIAYFYFRDYIVPTDVEKM